VPIVVFMRPSDSWSLSGINLARDDWRLHWTADVNLTPHYRRARTKRLLEGWLRHLSHCDYPPLGLRC
jgi:hypothetical protein